MSEHAIYWDDLKNEVKESIASAFGLTPEELEKLTNWDVVPIFVFEIPEDEVKG